EILLQFGRARYPARHASTRTGAGQLHDERLFSVRPVACIDLVQLGPDRRVPWVGVLGKTDGGAKNIIEQKIADFVGAHLGAQMQVTSQSEFGGGAGQ